MNKKTIVSVLLICIAALTAANMLVQNATAKLIISVCTLLISICALVLTVHKKNA